MEHSLQTVSLRVCLLSTSLLCASFLATCSALPRSKDYLKVAGRAGGEFAPSRPWDTTPGREPSCEELLAMWRFSKRQSRATELTNEIAQYRDPFAYNVWEAHARSRSAAGAALKGGGRRHVYGRVVHAAPRSRGRDGQYVAYGPYGMPPPPPPGPPQRGFEEVARHLVAYPPERPAPAGPPRRKVTAFRFSGGVPEPVSVIAPQAGSFQQLKDIIRAERARELQQQRLAEEAAARAAALRGVAGPGFSGAPPPQPPAGGGEYSRYGRGSPSDPDTDADALFTRLARARLPLAPDAAESMSLISRFLRSQDPETPTDTADADSHFSRFVRGQQSQSPPSPSEDNGADSHFSRYLRGQQSQAPSSPSEDNDGDPHISRFVRARQSQSPSNDNGAESHISLFVRGQQPQSSSSPTDNSAEFHFSRYVRGPQSQSPSSPSDDEDAESHISRFVRGQQSQSPLSPTDHGAESHFSRYVRGRPPQSASPPPSSVDESHFARYIRSRQPPASPAPDNAHYSPVGPPGDDPSASGDDDSDDSAFAKYHDLLASKYVDDDLLPLSAFGG